MAFLYRFTYFRILISVFRYLFFNLTGQFKTYYDKHSIDNDNLINYESGKTTITHNLVYRNLPKNFSYKQIKKSYFNFLNKAEALVYPLKAIDYIDYKSF